MEQYIYGILHGVIESKRLIAIKGRKKVEFYYMSKSMFKQFMQYFEPGIYIFMDVKNTTRIYRGFLVKNVIAIDKILSPNKNKPTVYYDISMIKSGIKSLINQDRYRLFMDFEMSMPPYNNYQNFVSEIIQIGYILTDNQGNVIEEFSSYIKPELIPEISIRTKKFLHINQEDVDQGKNYKFLHQKIMEIQKKYNPIVYVWGKNDQLELNKLNRIHRLNNFAKTMQFIDLLSMHKLYYGLKNDVGLFNAYNIYSKEDDLTNQKHDAFEDAFITKEIFYAFKDVCNNKRLIQFE
ncbi:MAG: exonuclease domain-containing protein [Candidatus Izemoplasmatales bacterium]|nr:exonuclease domain-containing protein [Candidatus Izemoplasmatales bacterium]